VPAPNTLVQILSDSREHDWVIVTLKYAHVVPDPSLDEGCKENGRKAGYEAQIPPDIHPDVRR
jgi:hypothetical protein